MDGLPAIETRRTFCRVCHAACPVDVDVDVSGPTERAVDVRGVPEDPLFEGYTCIKGRQLAVQHHDAGRLRRPLRRRADGTFSETTSAGALDEIAARIDAIVRQHGPRAVASYTGTGAYQNSTSVPVAAAWHRGFDSPSFYTSLTIDQPAHRSALLRLGAWEAGWDNFTTADVTMAIGYNPMVSSYGPAGGLQGTNPFVALRRAKERGLKVIVIDPRRSELATQADVWLQVQPGEDPTLLAGIIREILAADAHDQEFCDRWVAEGHLDSLRLAVDPFTLDYVAKRCRVDAADVARAAELFAAGPRGTAGTGTGPNMAAHGTLTEHLALTLNVLCGRVLRAGDTLESGYFLFPGDTRRAQVVPPSDPMPGAPHRMGGLRGLPGEMLTNRLADEMLMAGEGRVRALIVSGGNPVVAFPDHAKTIEALESLELLVVIDHRMTATAELADYVLAPRLELERADVPHIQDRRFPLPYVNHTPAVLEPGPEDDLLTEWEVFAGIASRTGTPIELPGGPLSVDGATDGSVTDDDVIDLVYAAARLPIDEIRANPAAIHADRVVRVVEADPDAEGRFHVAPADVVEELATVVEEGEGTALLGVDPSEWPFRLVSRRLKHVLNSLGRELEPLAAKGTTNPVYVNPDDVRRLGVEVDTVVEVTSPFGQVLAVVAEAPEMKPGVVAMSHAWGGRAATDEKVRIEGSPTNRLISTDVGYDPITGMAVQSAIPVKITGHEEP
ncbi:MAG: molybdopterin-dependent oxidoreductase [Actinomycetota bacterium]